MGLNLEQTGKIDDVMKGKEKNSRARKKNKREKKKRKGKSPENWGND